MYVCMHVHVYARTCVCVCVCVRTCVCVCSLCMCIIACVITFEMKSIHISHTTNLLNSWTLHSLTSQCVDFNAPQQLAISLMTISMWTISPSSTTTAADDTLHWGNLMAWIGISGILHLIHITHAHSIKCCSYWYIYRVCCWCMGISHLWMLI